ncbi:DUF397 domain-containing protein [Streptomyces sp. NPDC000410]|uniref:DUF397 domain-containing protein n=1 Tax=Streptomyces sp. NPDC000410 TaxID=3154254 RepID=UPI003332CE5D
MHALECGNVAWRKSSYSGGGSSGGDCIEVAGLASSTAVRDSKVPAGPRLVFETTAWASFVEAVKADGRPAV